MNITIRRLYEVHGMTIGEIAYELKIDRRVVREALK